MDDTSKSQCANRTRLHDREEPACNAGQHDKSVSVPAGRWSEFQRDYRSVAGASPRHAEERRHA